MDVSDKTAPGEFEKSFDVFPTLETEHLVLSEILPADAESYHRQQRSVQDMPGRPPWSGGFEAESVENAQASIGFARKAWEKRICLPFGVRLRSAPETGEAPGTFPSRLIGCCALFGIEREFKGEIGYWFGADYQNKGLMTEAVTAVVKYAFGTMGMGRLFAQISTHNPASAAMLRKAGFVQEGVLRRHNHRDGVWDDTALMAILASDI